VCVPGSLWRVDTRTQYSPPGDAKRAVVVAVGLNGCQFPVPDKSVDMTDGTIGGRQVAAGRIARDCSAKPLRVRSDFPWAGHGQQCGIAVPGIMFG
jgi:hypothetical protein